MPPALGLKQFRAWITSGGESLDMYAPVISKQTSTVSCFIPAEAGQHFAVNWEDLGTGIDSAAYIFLDGFAVPGRYLFGKGLAWRNGVRASDKTEKPFAFGTVDDAEPRVKFDSKRHGQIVLKIRRIVRQGGHELNPIISVPNHMPGANKICVKLGQEMETSAPPPATWKFKPYDEENPHAYVTFIFKYRPQSFIDEQGFEPMDAEESEEEDVKPMAPPRTTTRNGGRKVSQRQAKESSPEASQESSASRTSVKRARVASTSTTEPRKSQRVAEKQTASSTDSRHTPLPDVSPVATPASATLPPLSLPPSSASSVTQPSNNHYRHNAPFYGQGSGAWNYASLAGSSVQNPSPNSYATLTPSAQGSTQSPANGVSSTGVQAIMASISPYSTGSHYRTG
ncbi:hypothetical protein PENSPDRAFT_296890 [Peniophora sp. CONT]|nr:hypothetical protein PENSPDRAFT_296890 [Peniophora sp. CONT]